MYVLRLSALSSAGPLFAAALALALALVSPVRAADSVAVNSAVTYQTMTGWEVHARAWEQDKVNNNFDPTARTYAPAVAAKLVNELGINRLQLPVRSGWMNNTDYWTRFVNRQISYTELGSHWYEKQSGAPFQYAEFDYNVETWLLPMKQLLEAKGERLYVSLIGVDFNSSSPGNFEFALNAAAYANFIKAYATRLKTKYGVTLDAFEITCEPENTRYWRGKEIGKAAVALDGMFKSSGFPSVSLIAPSVTYAYNALPYMNEVSTIPGAIQALDTIAYHRYNPGDYAAISAYAKANGLQTAMSEWFNATIDTIFDDLTIANATFWQKWAIAGRKGIGSNPQAFHYTADFANPSNPTFTFAPNSAPMQLFFKYVRLGAVRTGATSATMRTVAFLNTNGSQVVVSKRNAGSGTAPVTFSGLRAGTYGIRAIGAGASNAVDLPDVTVGTSGSVTVTLPEGYSTLYGKSTTPPPPPPPQGTLSLPGTTTFATQAVGTTSAATTVTLSNTGGSVVTVQSIVSSNPTEFIVSASTCNTVAAGASCSFKVAFKPSASGARTGVVTLSSNGVGSPQKMNVSGTGTTTVVPPGTLSLASALALGSTQVGSTGSPSTVTVSNTGGAAVTVQSIVSSSPAEFIVSGSTCTTVNVGASCSFKVAFKPAATGARTGVVTLSSNGVGSPQKMNVSGTGTATAVVPPGKLSFVSSVALGTTPVGTISSPNTVTVNNVGGTAVAVQSIVSSVPGEFVVSGSTCGTLAAGASCAFKIAFKPAAIGARSASVRLTSNGVGSPQVMSVSGTGASATSPGQLSMLPTLSFANQPVGTTSIAKSVTVTNIGSAAVTVSGIASSNPAEFVISSSTCATVAAGGTCTFRVAFKPAASGIRASAITIASNGVPGRQMSATGSGTASSGDDRLSLIANTVFVAQEIGTTSAKRTIAIQNTGTKPVTVYGVFATSPLEFPVSDSNCGNLGPGATCTFKVAFKPVSTGTRTGGVTIASSSTVSTQSMTTTGIGALPGTLSAPEGTVEMVEYHHADWDHYFMTANPEEIEKLDSGVFSGWDRTGYAIRTFSFGGERGATVCRFFSESFAPMSSHFYTPYADECAIVNGNLDWSYEGEVFNIEGAAVDGACPADTVPVYRLYNNGRGESPNHRYTTDIAVRNAMLENGWVAEGNGADGVFMCSPQ